MKKEEIMAKLEDIFKDLLDDEDFILEPGLIREDCPEWDSLFHITLMTVVSDEFDVSFTMPEIVGVKGIDQLIKMIEEGK